MRTAAQPGADAEAPPQAYDLSLFEELNDQYEDCRLVPAPSSFRSDARLAVARRRVGSIMTDLDLVGRRVLELGTGHGHTASAAVHKGHARSAVGVDVKPSPTWEELADSRVRFITADLARDFPLPAESFDVIISYNVLEHVDRPLSMIGAIERLLCDGGEAWITFNLYRGPKASHRYREVFFPWPHLLFEPAVCRAFYEKHHSRSKTFSWVNHLTAAEYLDGCVETGLNVEALRRTTTAIDLPFYARFEEKLGRYPALDLETDFMWLKLSKGGRTAPVPARLAYLDRQREFYAELDRARKSIPARYASELSEAAALLRPRRCWSE